ncbi:hypothetical protein BC332_27591 [Capsicum chinense]|uniref:Uncharacterized protein n=1 Tax=Capsicum annuum TaxID=4072 RepID=A0A1U8G2B9_CAPAN|nr:uncharacterized protein LOC107861935 [Capsicum annuum]KAF3669200.1 hypothetical protein FXO37_09172 [Capsicum annuum]KAF3680722.1 hypothetical protein FXO38_02148 [Capsicum annuum]PHT88393.1 hypothetical protein T459_10499 [Capsicum annuum]PHU02340.1 hypothetical protein BC332_27591 [Capsicum chinense]
MANQGSDNLYSSINVPGQAQMRREDLLNQPSNIHNPSQGQATNLFQETGTQVKNMAQGAAGSAVNMARGAASGAANMAQGAADAVKNTLGMNPPHNTTDTTDGNYLNQPGTINFDDDFPNSTTSSIPGNTNLDGLNYPTNPNNPSTGI